MPNLHLISAGSLLEFALEELPSFGVGHIRSMFLYPMSFSEFLKALGFDLLQEAMKKADVNSPLTEPVHKKLISLFKEFLIIGGMPEVVAKYAENNDLRECQAVLDDLIISLQADFTNHKQIQEVVEILILAHLVIPVTHSSANGLPLGAEANSKKRKLMLFDTGVTQLFTGIFQD